MKQRARRWKLPTRKDRGRHLTVQWSDDGKNWHPVRHQHKLRTRFRARRPARFWRVGVK